MLVKCHEHFHPLIRSNKNYVDEDIFYEDCNLEMLLGLMENFFFKNKNKINKFFIFCYSIFI
jgi:hypothetical protein